MPHELTDAILDSLVLYPGNVTRLNIWMAVLSSKKIPYELSRLGGDRILLVRLEHAERAQAEIASYESRNWVWPPIFVKEDKAESSPVITATSAECGVTCMLLLAAVHYRAFLSKGFWQEAGHWNGEKIMSGDWWRVFTALTLHGDENHLLANLFWLALLVAILGCDIGGGLAILMMVLAGALGNAAMVALGATHSSLGASTMVFALVGLLCAIRTVAALQKRIRHGGNFLTLLPWVPLFAGVSVFAFYGTAPSSDILAHATGLASGVLLGLPCAFLPRCLRHPWLQLLFGALALGLVAFAWHAAL